MSVELRRNLEALLVLRMDLVRINGNYDGFLHLVTRDGTSFGSHRVRIREIMLCNLGFDRFDPGNVLALCADEVWLLELVSTELYLQEEKFAACENDLVVESSEVKTTECGDVLELSFFLLSHSEEKLRLCEYFRFYRELVRSQIKSFSCNFWGNS